MGTERNAGSESRSDAVCICGGFCPEQSEKTRGIGWQTECSPTLRGGRYSSNIICLEGNGYRPSHKGDGWAIGGAMYTLNSTEVHAVCYSLSSFNSNAMKSDNPQSGIYVSDVARAIDMNGCNPACYQGGIIVHEKRYIGTDCDHIPCIVAD